MRRLTFESAGGHEAPQGKQHGFLDEAGPHAGDLPNIHVLESGNISFEYYVDRLTLAQGTPASLLDQDGSALAMHAGADDYHTNPAGNAGERLVCGVIRYWSTNSRAFRITVKSLLDSPNV
jgi:Cu-Zn family superoxide dismutase